MTYMIKYLTLIYLSSLQTFPLPHIFHYIYPDYKNKACDTQFCYKLQLKDEDEVKKVVVDEEEYCASEWKLPSQILEGNFHPALKYAVGCMLAGESLDALQKCEEQGGRDADIAKLSREFLTRRKAVDEIMKKSNEYKLDSKALNYQTTVTSKY